LSRRTLRRPFNDLALVVDDPTAEALRPPVGVLCLYRLRLGNVGEERTVWLAQVLDSLADVERVRQLVTQVRDVGENDSDPAQFDVAVARKGDLGIRPRASLSASRGRLRSLARKTALCPSLVTVGIRIG